MAMKMTVLIINAFLLFGLLFSLEMQVIEGRRLMSEEERNREPVHASLHSTINGSRSIKPPVIASMPQAAEVEEGQSEALPPPPAPSHDTENFRPTTPGHSPGIGHSIHN